jgi:hypothetical protein
MYRYTLRASPLLAGLAALLLGLGGSPSAGQAGKEKASKEKGGKEEPGKGKVVEVPPKQGKSEVIRLFNEKNLDGWEGHIKKYWSIQDVPVREKLEKGEKKIPTVKAIVGKNTENVPTSTYLLTKRKFSDFRLTAQVKLVKWKSDMHSGIAFWGRKAPDKGDDYTYAGHLVMFPTGWGMFDLYGRGMLPPSGEPAKKVGRQWDWNDLEILAQGNRVRVAVNGKLVVDWRDPEPKRILEGPIGLQLHSNKLPQEVQFRDLILTTFPEPQMITVR